MKRRPRIYYSDSQKALMWARWKQGWTLHEIGKLFDRPHTSIHRILAVTGGFQPSQRSRASTVLTLAERDEISRAMVAGESIRSTAARLGRAPSTISREIQRNGGGFYGGPKIVQLRGTLERDGVAPVHFNAQRQSFLHFGLPRSTCNMVGRATYALGGDIAAWLEEPVDGAKLGEL